VTRPEQTPILLHKSYSLFLHVFSYAYYASRLIFHGSAPIPSFIVAQNTYFFYWFFLLIKEKFINFFKNSH
jgi:hypothetical protein